MRWIGAAFILAVMLVAPAIAQSPVSPFYGAAPAVAPLPAPGVPSLPTWSLKASGEKPIMGSVDKHPMLDGPNIVDLKAMSYVEEEYFLTGKANLYAQDGEGVTEANVPYVTRIIVRRPESAARFSGTIVMEPSRDVNEWTTTWPSAAPYMLRAGHVFVAFTSAKSNLADFFYGYDQARYGALCLDHEGLRWDIMAGTAALLRDPTGPLGKAGFLAEAAKRKGGLKLISTGVSLTARMQALFIDNGHHARARRAGTDNGANTGGGPLIDGYFMIGGGRPRTLPSDAPVISLIAEGDVARPLAAPRPGAEDTADQDDPNGTRFRWYEMAGTAHANWGDQSQFTPAFQLIGAKEKSTVKCKTPVSATAVKDAYVSAALANLEIWLRGGPAPPQGRRLETDGLGTIKRDNYGNAIGGLRPHWIEVRLSRVTPVSQESPEFPGIRATGGLCGMFANEKPLSYAALLPLYHDHATYMAKVEAHLKSEVSQRYLLPEDAVRQLGDARQAKVP